jgi:hypothetical protein
MFSRNVHRDRNESMRELQNVLPSKKGDVVKQ